VPSEPNAAATTTSPKSKPPAGKAAPRKRPRAAERKAKARAAAAARKPQIDPERLEVVKLGVSWVVAARDGEGNVVAEYPINDAEPIYAADERTIKQLTAERLPALRAVIMQMVEAEQQDAGELDGLRPSG